MTEENKFLKSQDELNNKIESSKTFLSNETLNYLKKVLNLDISVLNDSKLNEIFKDNYYFPIALYNLCERTKLIINKLYLSDDIINYSYNKTCFSVDYTFSKSNLVAIFALPDCYNSCNLSIIKDLDIEKMLDNLRTRYNFLYNLGEQNFKEKEEMVYTYQSILYILNNRKTIEDTNSAIINSLLRDWNIDSNIKEKDYPFVRVKIKSN